MQTKLKVIEVKLPNNNQKTSLFVKILGKNVDFKPQITKSSVNNVWDEIFLIDTPKKVNPLSIEKEQLEIVLLQKSFFHSDNCLGGLMLDLSTIRESKKGIKFWFPVYPLTTKKKNSSPNLFRESPVSPKYNPKTEPIAELMLHIEMIFSEVKKN